MPLRVRLVPALLFVLATCWAGAETTAMDAPGKETLEQVLAHAAEAERRWDLAQALVLYRRADGLEPDNAFVLQKIARQLSDAVADAKTREERRQLAEEALAYSLRAQARAPDDPVCALSVAICYGKLALTADASHRIKYAGLVRDHAERALQLNPDYDWAHHVLGRWHYELAQVGGPTRALARLFYSAVPAGTCAEGIDHLARAVALAPENPSHRIELGLARIACGRRDEGLADVRLGLSLPSREKHDESAKARARAALQRLGT